MPELDLKNLNGDAVLAIELARAEAKSFHHNYVGTEHLLLALVNLESPPRDWLLAQGVTREVVRARIEELTGVGLESTLARSRPYTPRVKRLITWARQKASVLQHEEVGTEHLFLSLIEETRGPAALILQLIGVDLEKLKNVDVRYLGRARLIETELRDPDLVNFTPRAMQVVRLARKETKDPTLIKTGHLLMALIGVEQGVAYNVLRRLEPDLEKIVSEVKSKVDSDPDVLHVGPLYAVPRISIVFKLAGEDSKRLGHHYIGTEHLLIGLMQEGQNLAARALANELVMIERTRHEILVEYDPDYWRTQCAAIRPRRSR